MLLSVTPVNCIDLPRKAQVPSFLRSVIGIISEVNKHLIIFPQEMSHVNTYSGKNDNWHEAISFF